jgi:chromosomal replication initiation ATPase DnaA
MTRYTKQTPFTYTERKIVDDLERCVCSIMSVESEQVKSKNLKTNVTLARGFIFYILHKRYGFSISLISKLYNRSIRNVFWHNDKIEHFLKQNSYKEIYNNIIISLK